MQEVTSMQLTEKNEKKHVILHLSIPEILLITQQLNVMFKCINENTFTVDDSK